MPLEIPSDTCVLRNVTRSASAFDLALQIVRLVGKSVQPIVTKFFPKTRASFSVLDETAKVVCFSYENLLIEKYMVYLIIFKKCGFEIRSGRISE